MERVVMVGGVSHFSAAVPDLVRVELVEDHLEVAQTCADEVGHG